MRQYLCEGVKGAFPFVVDRKTPLVFESQPKEGGVLGRIPGRFSVCDCVNGNGRRYRKQVWEKNLQPDSPLMQSISKSAAFGLLEHPKDGIITLESPISHQVTSAQLVESKDETGKTVHEVVGEISLYNTPEGSKLRALIEGGYNPLVSSRGYGSLEKSADGVDEVQEDYVCESWDVVIKPSFATAELSPDRPLSGTTARMAPPVAPNPTAESAGGPAAKPEQKLEESQPPSGSSSSPASASNQPSTHRMEINEIKTQINGLRSAARTTQPQRFAESMAEIETAHNRVAEWSAADAKRSWEAQKLHKELDGIAEQLTASVKQPERRLTEHNTKLMKVITAVAQSGLAYKKRLGESLTKVTRLSKIGEELTRRGQGWREIAENRKGELRTTTKQFDTACEALDIMAARYHADTTELGRRVLQLEFKEQLAAKPEMAQRLKEATRLRHVVSVREALEGKPSKPAVREDKGKGAGKPAEGAAPGKEGIKDDKQKGAANPGEGKVADEPGKVTNESKSKFSTKPGDPRGLNESVEMVRRLSGATAATAK